MVTGPRPGIRNGDPSLLSTSVSRSVRTPTEWETVPPLVTVYAMRAASAIPVSGLVATESVCRVVTSPFDQALVFAAPDSVGAWTWVPLDPYTSATPSTNTVANDVLVVGHPKRMG